MPSPTPHPFETWRTDLALCAGEFRRGLISEAGFRHHLNRLGYLPHEIEAEVEHHRTHPPDFDCLVASFEEAA